MVVALALALAFAGCQAGAEPASATRSVAPSASADQPVTSFGPTIGPTSEPAATPTIAPTSPAPTPSRTASPTVTPIPAPTIAVVTEPPPAPTGVALAQEDGPDASGLVVRQYTISWEAPLTSGVTIRIYGVTKCLNPPTSTGVPCVVDGMKLPASARTVVGRGPAEEGAASWRWPMAEVDGPVLAWDGEQSYYAFVVAAVNDAGRSPFVVVRSAVSCSDCMS